MNRFLAPLFALLALFVVGCRSNPPKTGPDDGGAWAFTVVNVYSGADAPPRVTSTSVPAMPQPACVKPVSSTGWAECDPATGTCALPPAVATREAPRRDFDLMAGLALAAAIFMAGVLKFRARRGRRMPGLGVAALPLVMALAGCSSDYRLASRADVDAVREDGAKAAESQRDAFRESLLAGKTVEEATLEAFGTNVAAQRKAQSDAQTAPPTPAIDWAALIGVILGGGTVGTVLTRVIRGSPLRSGSVKPAAASKTA